MATHTDLTKTRAEIAANGGQAWHSGLYRRSDGARMRAKLVSYACRYSGATRWAWSFRTPDGDIDRSAPFLGDARSTRGKLHKLGFEVRDELAPSYAFLRGDTTGIALHVRVVRDDAGYPPDAVGWGE